MDSKLSPAQAPFIGVDWGSTHARAMLFGSDGALLEAHEAPLGIKHIAAGQFRPAFDQLTSRWRARHGPVTTLLSGMIGSRTGWHEAPYVPCPAQLPELHRSLVRVPGVENVWLVPGLCLSSAPHDVMRGEELQLLGLGEAVRDFGWVCIPGTHSKWVRAEWPHVREFRTAMTGEVFAAIAEHTLFAKIIPSGSAAKPSFDPRAFEQGLGRSAAPHGLLNALFGIRADFLLAGTPATAIADLISGLLIGTEIRQVLAAVSAPPRVALLASASLEQRYLHALRFLGLETVAFDVKQTTARGFAALMRTWRK